jgi:hypothetical protein
MAMIQKEKGKLNKIRVGESVDKWEIMGILTEL